MTDYERTCPIDQLPNKQLKIYREEINFEVCGFVVQMRE